MSNKEGSGDHESADSDQAASSSSTSSPSVVSTGGGGEDTVEGDVEQEIYQQLRDVLPEDKIRVIAPRLRQIFLSVEHRYEPSDVESVGEAARIFEGVAPGRGQGLLDAFLENYRSRTRQHEREQTAQHVALYAGLIIAAIVALLLIGGAVYSISQGYVGGAVAFLSAAAISMIAGFVDASTRRREADRG